ncbi:MAG TPA: DUF6265 family protein [Chitinophaga sp.]|nr:DUF6265 family protein [Chitinophaga sp.]
MAKKPWFRSSLLLCVCLLVCRFVNAQVSSSEFNQLDKMEGRWVMKTKRSIYREHWKRLDENTWKGRTWRISGGDSTQMDEMQLFRTAEGIFFSVDAVRDPQSGQPVRFKLRVLKPVGFVAENLECDFPQKVVYRWKGNDRMEAHFEGKKDKTFSEIIMQYEKE